MRAVFGLMMLLLVATALALFTQTNPGNVAFFYPPYRVDLSLNLFLLLLVAIFSIAYFSLRSIASLVDLPRRALRYRRTQRMEQASSALCEAWISLNAGRFSRAEKMVREAQNWPAYRQTAALIGARAAQGLHEIARRDGWLNQIKAPALQQARLVAQAEMLLESREPHLALASLAPLQAQGARQIHVQRIALRAQQALKNNTEVLRLVRILEKRKILHPTVITHIKQQACEHLLKERRHNATALLTFWRSLSLHERCLPNNANLMARLLIPLEHHVTAKNLLEQALNELWEPNLLLIYAECVATDTSALPLISKVEQWRTSHPREAMLHYALGRLCWHQRLWGKAQASLEECLVYAQDDIVMQYRAHLALAQLHERLEHHSLACKHYRTSALLMPTKNIRP